MAGVVEELKRRLRATPVGALVRRWRRWRVRRAWATRRTVPPPPEVKQALVRAVGRRYGLRVLVETGTYEGEMVAAVRRAFARVYSIELDPALAARARARFRGDPRVTILEGDSARVLPTLLAALDEPCLFWLDGHDSGGATARGPRATPVREELAAIFAHPVRAHVVLVDDARLFTGADDYPTLAEVAALARAAGYGTVEVRDDVIHIRR